VTVRARRPPRRPERRTGFLLLVLLASLASPLTAPAVAETPPRAPVVLFAAPDDPLAGRLAAEIEAQGLTVERLVAPPELEAAAQRALTAGARVAVFADASRRRTEVWGGGEVALKQALEVPEATAPDAALPLLALRTVELLRVEYGLGAPPPSPPSPPPPPPSPAPPSATIATPAPEPLPVTVAVASGILAGTGRIGPLPIVGLGLAAQMTRAIGAELWGYAPLVADELRDTGGTARTSVWLAAAGVRLAPPPGTRLAFDFGAGPLLALVRATGTATPPATGATDQQLAVALYARAALRIRAGTHWSFGLQLFGGTALRRPVVTFVDKDVTTWGKAFAAIALSAAYAF
jgi:hypothetical protein